MMKLNGTTYLNYHEVDAILDTQLSKFSTSQHIILPADISYIDAEFVSYMKDRAKDVFLGLGFLYKDDEYVSLSAVTNMLKTFLFSDTNTSAETTFLRTNLTDAQKKIYREKYGHYLLNMFIGEVVKQVVTK